MRRPKTIKVMIVDEHSVMRRGLAMILQQDRAFKVIGQADGEVNALKILKENTPDCIILDISFKENAGFDFVKKIRSKIPHIRILVISIHEELFYVEQALLAGARAYVTKQEAADKIVDAARVVLKGGIYVSEQFAQKIMGRIALSESSVSSV